MSLSNIFDLTDALMQILLCIIGIERLDINISIGMVCRIIFFIILISIRDLTTYTIGEFLAQVSAWFIFHVYILYYEKEYFLNGQSKEINREKQFKIMDTLQLIIGTIYLAFTFNSTIEILILTFFAINLFFNVCELIYIQFFKKIKGNDYQKDGGYKQMYLGFFLGAVGVLIFLIDATSKYSNEIEASSSKLITLILTIIGQFIVVLSSLALYCHDTGILFTWSNDWTKGILGFLYGANIGVFSIFYGYLTGVIIFIYMICSCCFVCHKPKQEQVHPTD